jgi:hypothetical protein
MDTVAVSFVLLTVAGVTTFDPMTSVDPVAKFEPATETAKVELDVAVMDAEDICGTGFKSCTDIDEVRLESAVEVATIMTVPADGVVGGV